MMNEIKHQAKACGAKYVTVTLDPLQRGSEAAYLRYAELCSRAGDELGKESIKLCYRFYHYDLTPIKHASHGRSWLDIFIEQTSAEHLLFELDTYFMSRAGVHHETIIEKCGGRCTLLHLCDIDDQARRATVGRGVISWTDLMHSLKGDSCPNVFIIENDTREGFASIRESFDYARKHFHWADPAQ
jgi:sugar phosphate isomerase/epimerase